MHYHCEVYLEKKGAYEEQVAEIMEPFDQNNCHCFENDGDERKCETSYLYDWYQIGGRWCGAHNKKYDPRKDSKNWEKCKICGGPDSKNPGTRRDSFTNFKSVPCNGCNGDFKFTGRKGVCLKWSSNYSHKSDIVEISKIPKNFSCYTFIINGGIFNVQEEKKTVPQILKELGIKKGYLVTVDYHS